MVILFNLEGKVFISRFPTDTLNHITISLEILKRYDILIHCGTENRNPKSYRKFLIRGVKK